MSTEPDYRTMWIQATERFVALGGTVLRLAAEGRWNDLVAYATEALHEADALPDEDWKFVNSAKALAEAAEDAVAGGPVSDAAQLWQRLPLSPPWYEQTP